MGDNHAAKVWRDVEPKNMGALSNAEAFIDDVDARIDDDDGEVCYDLLVKLVGFTKLLDEKVRNLVRFYDNQIGTPCEQIRHQHEVEEMKAQHELIVAGLEGGVLAAFPTNWCDPLLTGDKAAVGSPPYGCPDIERLIRAIKRRVSDAFLAQTAEGVK